ncbi:MFS transporter [Mucilaginibacter sp.]
MQNIKTNKLFVASCLSLLVTSLSFGIRAGIMGQLGTDFNLNASELSTITATAFWGFPLAVVIGGFIVDLIGMKRLLVMAFVFHLLGIVLTIFAQGYWTLFFSTLLIGIANGTVEASCNPLVTALYPENKTTRLNYFHLWFPGGIVIGSLLVLLFTHLGLNWQIQVGVMIVPTLIYGYLFSKLDFPVTERVAAGFTTADMYKGVLNPLYIFMFVCMCGTAITELFTNQWTGVLFKAVTNNAILILTFVATIQVICRAFAGPIVHRLAPQGVLLISTILSALGIFLLVTLQGNAIFFAATVFGLGVAFFWPCMIGFVAENIPQSGALGINLLGGGGMLAVSFYTIFMGGFYDNHTVKHLAAGASLTDYQKAAADTPMANELARAQSLAGFDVLHTTLLIPIVLIVAFGGLVFYMNTQRKKAAVAN